MTIPMLDLWLAKSDRGESARQLVLSVEDSGFLYLQNVKGYQPDQYNMCLWRYRVYLLVYIPHGKLMEPDAVHVYILSTRWT